MNFLKKVIIGAFTIPLIASSSNVNSSQLVLNSDNPKKIEENVLDNKEVSPQGYFISLRKKLSLKDAENIIKEYNALVTGVGYAGGPGIGAGKFGRGPPYEKTISDFLKKHLGLEDLDNYSNEISIQDLNMTISDYSRLEEMILDMRFSITSVLNIEQDRAVERIYKGKDAFNKKDYDTAVKWFRDAIEYMYHTNDYVDEKKKYMHGKDWSRRTRISETISMLQARYLSARAYEGIGDKVNAQLAYTNVLEFNPPHGKNKLILYLQERAQESISRIGSE